MWAVVEALQQQEELRGGPMRAPDEVAAMVRLKALGWGIGGSPSSLVAAT